jgi:hypothetical protein
VWDEDRKRMNFNGKEISMNVVVVGFARPFLLLFRDCGFGR